MVVVIPTHGRSVLLKRTLDSLEQCQIPGSFEGLFLVENGSREGAEALADELPGRLNARYMHVELGNKSHALNRALAEIEEQSFIVFLDDDVRVHPDAFLAYARAGEEYGRGFFFGGPVQVDREERPAEWLEPLLPYSAKGYDLVHDRMGGEYLGFNWAAFAGDLKALGGFNPQVGPGSPSGASGQETEMQMRMQVEGMEGVDVPQALVWHYVPESRCNPQWVLRHSFRNGMQSGLTADHWKAPARAMKYLLKHSFRWMSCKINSDKVRAYRSKMECWKQVGFMKGLWERRDLWSVFSERRSQKPEQPSKLQ